MYNTLMPFTFFLDMLGFGNKVGRIKNSETAKEFVDFMEVNKQIFDEWIQLSEQNDNKTISLDSHYEFKYTFISDSIVMSFVPKKIDSLLDESEYYKYSANLFYMMVNRIITILTNMLLKHKILLRGGVSRKFTYIQNEFVVGEGLIEAYKLESITAITPRIILSKEFTDDTKFMKSLKVTSNQMYNGNRIIKCDVDKYFYIDYLGYLLSSEQPTKIMQKVYRSNEGEYKHALESRAQSNTRLLQLHKFAIEDMRDFLRLKEASEEYVHIQEKYIWIRNYHNSHLKQKRNDFKIID